MVVSFLHLTRFCVGSAAPVAAGPSPTSRFLLPSSPPLGLTAQLLALLRAMWVARATGAILVLPPVTITFANMPAKQVAVSKYIDVEVLTRQVGERGGRFSHRTRENHHPLR